MSHTYTKLNSVSGNTDLSKIHILICTKSTLLYTLYDSLNIGVRSFKRKKQASLETFIKLYRSDLIHLKAGNIFNDFIYRTHSNRTSISCWYCSLIHFELLNVVWLFVEINSNQKYSSICRYDQFFFFITANGTCNTHFECSSHLLASTYTQFEHTLELFWEFFNSKKKLLLFLSVFRLKADTVSFFPTLFKLNKKILLLILTGCF